MKVIVPAFIALAVPFAAVPLAPAAAQTQDVYQTDISTLRSAVVTLAISGKNAEKDRSGLLGKLDAASSALAIGKTADAVQKLGDFERKIQQLAAAGRISSTDAADLITQADDAIACANGL